MKTFKRAGTQNLFEVVVPFGDGIAGFGRDELFDDCPVCQELKKQLAAGVIDEIEVDETTE